MLYLWCPLMEKHNVIPLGASSWRGLSSTTVHLHEVLKMNINLEPAVCGEQVHDGYYRPRSLSHDSDSGRKALQHTKSLWAPANWSHVPHPSSIKNVETWKVNNATFAFYNWNYCSSDGFDKIAKVCRNRKKKCVVRGTHKGGWRR